jgi:hypothetical protein
MLQKNRFSNKLRGAGWKHETDEQKKNTLYSQLHSASVNATEQLTAMSLIDPHRV